MDIDLRKFAFDTQDSALCCESPMERELYSELLRNGIRPIMQQPIGKYFADFALSKEKVVIEYDGPQHEQQQEYDQVRDAFMQGQGWTVYRVSGRRFCQIRKAGEFWALIQKFDRAVSYIVCDARGKIDEWIDTVREEGEDYEDEEDEY